MNVPSPIVDDGKGKDGSSQKSEEDGCGKEGKWGKWEYEGGRRRRCVGVELLEIPLCTVCVVETEGETKGDVLRRGLEAVSRFDGGLSRERLKMLSEDGDGGELKVNRRRRLQASRRPRARTCEMGSKNPGGSCACSAFEEDRLPLLENAAAMGFSVGPGSPGSDTHWHSDSEAADLGQIETDHPRPGVYVSVFEPFNELLFTQSTPKPLPKWKNLPDDALRAQKRRKTEPQYKGSTMVRETTYLGPGAHFISGNGSHSSYEDPSETAVPTRKNSKPPISPPLTPNVSVQETNQEHEGESREGHIRNRKRKSSSISFHPKITRDCILVEPDERAHRHSKIVGVAASPGISTALPPRERTPYQSIEDTDANMSPKYFARDAPALLGKFTEETGRNRRSAAPSPEPPPTILASELAGKWSGTPSTNNSYTPDAFVSPDPIPNPFSTPGVVSPVPMPPVRVPLLSKSMDDLECYEPDSPDSKAERDTKSPAEDDLQKIKVEKTRMLDRERWEERVRERERIFGEKQREGLERREKRSMEALHMELTTLFAEKGGEGKVKIFQGDGSEIENGSS
ncbi:hypothetical protein HYALB_00004313 [Hymenoscyphus albidus]|uniref:Uncharacterized protein n=1 Tax=Hymenoscyphus albidus TaxID=595503 RepID=A0A9N9M3J9_9HELO|nr:hypothetical protein HYALB_00004313 [Hymenoscyphus albidus]